jgi:two-component system, LytTR family, sensor kinase
LEATSFDIFNEEFNVAVSKLLRMKIRWTRFLLFVPIISLAIIYFTTWDQVVNDAMLFIRQFFITSFITVTIWICDAWVFIWFTRMYPNYKDTFKRLLFTIPTFALCTLLVYAIDCYLLCTLIFKIPVFSKFGENIRLTYVVSSLVYITYECIFFFKNWEKTVLYAEQLQKEHTKAQYESLKNQINPHFLFNSLNTLSAIIPMDADKAVDFVHKLSNSYRYLLKMKERELVPLDDELEFMHAYLFLIKSRYGDNIRITIHEKIGDKTLLLPPVSLQMLLENCIKHNVISKDKPLNILIHIDQTSISIHNNLQPKQMPEPSTGLGLENIKKRYAVLSDKTVVVHKTTEYFEVILPLLNLEV